MKKEGWKRMLARMIAIVMLISYVSTPAYAGIVGGVMQKSAGEAEEPIILTKHCGGMDITLTAEPGVLRAGTDLYVNRVYDSGIKEALEKTLTDEEKVETYIAFDIMLLLNGEEVQPDGKVQISFANIPFGGEAEKENSELVVSRISDNQQQSSELASCETGTSELSVDTTHFSVYAVWIKDMADQTKAIQKPYQSKNDFQYLYTDDQGNVNTLNSAAFDFHLFGEKVTINAHTNGNIAADYLVTIGADFGNHQNKEDGVEETNYIGMVTGNVNIQSHGDVVFGKNENVALQPDQEHVVISRGDPNNPIDETTLQGSVSADRVYHEDKTSDPYIHISDELQKLEILSVEFAKHGTSSGVVYTKESDFNKASVIDVSQGEDINFLNVSANQLLSGGSKTTLKIVGTMDKTLIINVDMTGCPNDILSMIVSEIEGFSNSETLVRRNCNVLWNLYERDENNRIVPYSSNPDQNAEPSKEETKGYTSVGMSDYFMGTILAPGANIYYGAVNGSIIGKNLLQGGKESHEWMFTGLTGYINVKKVCEGLTGKFYFALFDVNDNRIAQAGIKSIDFTQGNQNADIICFQNLPYGTYRIYETDAAGNILHPSDYIIAGAGQDVNITSTCLHSTVVITNSKEKKKTGTLTISKQYSGRRQAVFEFIVEGPNDYKRSVSVAAGQSAVLTDLMFGVYTVREVNGDAYDCTMTPADGIVTIGEGDAQSVTVTAVNRNLHFAVNKVDFETGEELDGALLQLIDGQGNVLDEWTSKKGETYDFGSRLSAGQTYRLREELSPAGYDVVRDILFTIDHSGRVICDLKESTDRDGNTVYLVEDQAKEKRTAIVRKSVSYQHTEMKLTNVEFYAALYSDPECTRRVSDIKKLVFDGTSYTADAVFDDLENGVTYYVGESDADGRVIHSGKLNGSTYDAKFTGTNGNVITAGQNGTIVIRLDNQLRKEEHHYYLDGSLTVIKELLGADGKLKKDNRTFYAGVFEDAQYKNLSEAAENPIMELKLSDAQTAQNTTKVSIPAREAAVTVYVTEVDKDGIPVTDAPEFRYTVSVKHSQLVFDKDHLSQTVTITNQEKNVETETEKETKKETEKKKEKETQKAKAVNTGDETPVLLYLLLMTAALAAGAAVIIRRKTSGRS